MFEDSVRVDPAVRFPALAAAIAEVPVRPVRGGTAAACAADTRALLELTRALQSRLHAQLACLDEQGFAAGLGFASTTAWVAAYANLDRSQARRVVLAARTADRLPLLGARHSDGKIGAEHLVAVAAGAPRVPDEVLAASDKTFADFSGSARPGELRLVAQRLQASYDHTAVTEDADHAHQARRLSLSRSFGDTWHLDGLLEPVDGAALDLALQSLMAPRGSDDDRTVTQRRVDALIELTQLALSGGQLPATGGDRPRLTFLVTAPTTHHPDGGDVGGGGVGGPIDIGCTHRRPQPGADDRDVAAEEVPAGGCHAGCPDSGRPPIPWPTQLLPGLPTSDHDNPDDGDPEDREQDEGGPEDGWRSHRQRDHGEPIRVPLDDGDPDDVESDEGRLDAGKSEQDGRGHRQRDGDEPDGGERGDRQRDYGGLIRVDGGFVPGQAGPGRLRAVELGSVEDPFDRDLFDRDLFDGAPVGGARFGGIGLFAEPWPPGQPPTEDKMLAVAGFGDGITDTSAQILGVHSLLPATTIARIGCNAEINTAVLNAAGDVLNYQRSRRRHTPAQGRAVVLRDQHCVFPGCDLPPWRCIFHHLEFWEHGGPTNLDHLALLCLFHHHRIHEDHWWLQRHQDHPNAAIIWVATAPDGHQLRQSRQPAA